MLGQPQRLQRPDVRPVPPPPSRPAADAAPAPAEAPPSDLITPAALAARLGVTTELLGQWRGSGEGPAYIRLTRKTVRYRSLDVDAFIADRVRASTAAA